MSTQPKTKVTNKTTMLISQNVTVFHHPDALTVTVSSPERVEEMRQLFQRALNTWDQPPSWIMKLSDALENMPQVPQKQQGKET